MAIFNNHMLLDHFGRVDHIYIRRSAEQRAYSLYGDDMRKSDIVYWVEKLTAIATSVFESNSRVSA